MRESSGEQKVKKRKMLLKRKVKICAASVRCADKTYHHPVKVGLNANKNGIISKSAK